MKCFLHPDLTLDRLVIVCKFDGISSQRRGSEINMELKKKEVLEDWCKSLESTNLICWIIEPREAGAKSLSILKPKMSLWILNASSTLTKSKSEKPVRVRWTDICKRRLFEEQSTGYFPPHHFQPIQVVPLIRSPNTCTVNNMRQYEHFIEMQQSVRGHFLSASDNETR